MSRVEIFSGEWTRTQVALDQERVYLFGDNLQDKKSGYVPSMTQAVIRGLPNAIGIPTKKKRAYDDGSYFWDTVADWTLFTSEVDKAIKQAKDTGKTIVIPSGGIGTGRAATRGVFAQRGNRFKAYLDEKLKELRGYGSIRVIHIMRDPLRSGERLFRIDRESPVGNPYHMKDESQRDMVCDQYDAYFKRKISEFIDVKFLGYLNLMVEALENGEDIALGCWCAPSRCHGYTIKAYLENFLAHKYIRLPDTDPVQAVMDQVRETGEWVIEERAGVTVEAIRFNEQGMYHYRAGHSRYPISDESLRKLIQSKL
jgi:hypothetical protein